MFAESDHSQLSLEDLTSDFIQRNQIEISRTAFHKKFTSEAVSFIKTLFEKHMAQYFDQELANSSFFSSVRIKDSTKYRLPSSFLADYPGFGSFNKDTALMNIQYEYDLITGKWLTLEPTKVTRNDQQDSKESVSTFKKGELLIRDLGYITTNYLVGIVENEAYFLNRLAPKIQVYTDDNIKICWKDIDSQMKKNKLERLELDVFLGKQEKIPTRLIIEPVPEQEYEKRIRKAVKAANSKNHNVSDEYRIRSKYNLFITNVAKEQIPASKIRDVYRIRWQIELVFKTWKSYLKLHKVKKVNIHRLHCQLFTKFLWILMNWKLFHISSKHIQTKSYSYGISIMRFFKRARQFSVSLRNVVFSGFSLTDWLKSIFIPSIRSSLHYKKTREGNFIITFNFLKQCLS